VNFKDENLRHIENIDLSNNVIQNIETKSFEHLKQLLYLDLSSNNIRSVAPESFKKLKNLENLDLRGNSIDCVALKNELSGVIILCSSSEEYAYDTTMATETLTKASDSNMEIPEVSYTDDTSVTTETLTKVSDSNMEIPEVSYTDDTSVTTVTLSTESSNTIERRFDSETVTKTNLNDTEMQITTSTKNYNSTVFGVTQIMNGVTAIQNPSTVPAINEDTSTAQYGIIIGVTVLILVCVGGMFFWHRKCKYTIVEKTDPEGELQDESDDKKSLCNFSSCSFITAD
jgi:hypothetical protein